MTGGKAALWSCNGKEFSAKFPDIAEALTRQVGVD